MVCLYGFTQLHLFHDLPDSEILWGTIFTTRNLWLLNCIAKKAFTIIKALLKKMTPQACRKELAVLDWISKPFYIFSFSLQVQMILRTQLRGSGAFPNARGRRGRWEAHCTPLQEYTSTQISQNVVCIVASNKKLFVCL